MLTELLRATFTADALLSNHPLVLVSLPDLPLSHRYVYHRLVDRLLMLIHALRGEAFSIMTLSSSTYTWSAQLDENTFHQTICAISDVNRAIASVRLFEGFEDIIENNIFSIKGG